jgi:hypothetical protein
MPRRWGGVDHAGAERRDERTGGEVCVTARGGKRSHRRDLADLGGNVDERRPGARERAAIPDRVTPFEHRLIDVSQRGEMVEVTVEDRCEVGERAEAAGNDDETAARSSVRTR